MKRERLRFFVSSPGDVTAARELVAQIIEKLAHEYTRFFELEPYLWEYEPMLASGHFQDSIEPPSQFDVVIIILESRLGTRLPERTAIREYRGIGGRTQLTGTEWEFEDALIAARERGVPDLLVYRSQRDARIKSRDPQSRRAAFEQLEALDAFWSRHFADQGGFIGAYSEFADLEEFAAKTEKDLRRCIERRIEKLRAGPQAAPMRLWAKDPFRGLEAYEFEHAPILFGRDVAIGAALLRLITNAEAGRPFLLVLGASGSGKSSLVKAGVVPRLLVPQRVSGAAFLRRVVFRASDAHAGEDLFDALARRLTEDQGAGIALPELLEGSMPVRELAQHLRQATEHPHLPFAMVLNRLAEAARDQGRMLRYQQPKLLLVIDQLEELYTGERVQAQERAQFVHLLAGLVRSGLVWVVATLRSDFWHRVSETPELLQLADGQGRLDLLPPTRAELTQMIRGPAEAAAINFEVAPATGIPLNDAIAEEAAAEPGVLPLMSYLLDQLYHSDVREGAETLTYATYRTLGGLKGAIARRADAVLSAQPDEVQRALRQVLFALVQVSATEGDVERVVARRAPLASFPEGSPKRRLIEALLDPAARLLVAEGTDAKGATVRVAHEALINEWATARDCVAANAAALKTRRMIEERHARWQELTAGDPEQAAAPEAAQPAASRSRERGLLTDVDLSDAERLLKDHREELAADVVAFIERSSEANRRRHRRAVRIASAIAAAMALLAVGAAYEAYAAVVQRNLAKLAATTAERTSRFMMDMFEYADPSKSRGATITVREVLDQGAKSIGSEPDLKDAPQVRADLETTIGRAYMGLGLYPSAEEQLAAAREAEKAPAVAAASRVRTLVTSGTTQFLAGDDAKALGFLRPAVDLARGTLEPPDPLRSEALTALGDVLVDTSKFGDAESLFNEALAADRKRPPTPENDAVLANTLDSLASGLVSKGDSRAAEAPMREALRLRTLAFGPIHPATALSMNNLGALFYQSGQYDAAVREYQDALPIYQKVFGTEHPEVATLLNNIGRSALMAGRVDEAEPQMRKSLEMTEKFDGPEHEAMVAPLNSLAMIDAYHGHLAVALQEAQRAEKIARLPDHGELLDQVLLTEGGIELSAGHLMKASTLLAESKEMLVKAHPYGEAEAWRYAVWDLLDARLAAARGDRAGALKTLSEAQKVIDERFGASSFYGQQAQEVRQQLQQSAPDRAS